MRQQNPSIPLARDPVEDAIYSFDYDSPLLTESLGGKGVNEIVYALAESEDVLICEDKEREKWKKRDETEEERTERIQAQRAKTEETYHKVEAGIEELAEALSQGKSEAFLTLLDAVSRFHRYSWGNTILIALQFPEATVVAGFTTWKAMGRYVKAGEKGIAILAPIPKRVKIDVENSEEETDTKATTKTITGSGVWGFKVVYVFDVSQTDGDPLPEFVPYHGDPQHYLTRLKEQVKAAGIVLEYRESLSGADGRSNKGVIELKIGQTPAQEFGTLVHEFAHERLHPSTESAQLSKTVKETEAEAVAYIVSRAIGLEPGTSSSDYIQLYQGDSQTLAASLERIQKTATQILSELLDDAIQASGPY